MILKNSQPVEIPAAALTVMQASKLYAFLTIPSSFITFTFCLSQDFFCLWKLVHPRAVRAAFLPSPYNFNSMCGVSCDGVSPLGRQVERSFCLYILIQGLTAHSLRFLIFCNLISHVHAQSSLISVVLPRLCVQKFLVRNSTIYSSQVMKITTCICLHNGSIPLPPDFAVGNSGLAVRHALCVRTQESLHTELTSGNPV